MGVFQQIAQLELAQRPIKEADAQALYLRLKGEAPKTVLEICQNAGQLSLLLAGFLAEQGDGTLTTFQGSTAQTDAEFHDHLAALDLSPFVNVLPAGRSYSWALQRLLSKSPRPVFDACILNGHKTWEASGFGLVLADLLLRPGGLLVLPDIHWSMAKSPYFRQRPHLTEKHDTDELQAQPVALAMDILLPRLGYQVIDAPELSNIALARKS